MAKRKSGRAAPDPSPKRYTVGANCGAEYHAWATRLARHVRLHMNQVVDRALVAYAKSHGFAEPPPERL